MSASPPLPGVLIDNKVFAGSLIREMQSPFTEEIFGRCATGDIVHADQAVDSAYRAFHQQWSRLDFAAERARCLLSFAEAIDQHAEKIIAAIVLDAGKPRFEAELETKQTAAAFRFFGGVADKLHGTVLPHGESHLAFIDRTPVGVVGCISPWNFPLQLMSWRVSSALAVGCTVVWKPAEEVLYSALQLFPLIQKCFPPGVFNVVNGKGSTVGMHLVRHPKVAKIAFTGSTGVGRKVAEAAASSNLKSVGLELGGKSPVVVLGVPPGSTLAQVAETAHHAMFWNSGQCCSAGSRTYVADEIFDEFVKLSVELCRNKVLGDPNSPKTGMGCVINKAQQKDILGFIERARKTPGVEIVYAGKAPAKGFFVGCHVITAPHDTEIAREEVFGPTQVIVRLPKNATDEQILHLANDSIFGLAGAFFGETGRCIQLARKTESGIVWINDYNVLGPHIPFGGVKETGGSSDLGLQALRNYTHTHTVIAKL